MAYRRDDLLAKVRERLVASPILQSSVGSSVLSPTSAWSVSTTAPISCCKAATVRFRLRPGRRPGLRRDPVVTDIASFRFMTAAGRIGALWPTGDAEALREAILKLSRQPLGPQRLAARAFFEESLSFRAICRQLWRPTVSCATPADEAPDDEPRPSLPGMSPGARCLGSELPAGHRFAEDQGVLVLLSSEMASRLEHFLEALRDYRQQLGVRILDERVYDGLPHSSQEHEVVSWFRNLGGNRFESHELFSAGDPAFGSSGLQLVDFDRDGDVDVLYSNGDTMDSYHLKPSHAIHLLENVEGRELRDHVLVHMPGVYRALAGDLDGDGDLDVAACAFIPPALLSSEDRGDYAALIWLEQTEPGAYQPHVLHRARNGHMALELGDWDADGDLDLAVGGHSSGQADRTDWVSLWWNEGPAGSTE